MVDVARAAKTIAKLTALKFFPSDPAGQNVIVEIACKLATDTSQIEWLVNQMLSWYNDWPGPREMRAVFCQRWKPADGPDINYSSVFAEGIFPGTEASGRKELSPADRMERRQIDREQSIRALKRLAE